MKIYLSGGLHSGWQDKFNGLDVIDPRKHGLKNPVEIKQWVMGSIRKADAIVCYFESTNPAGFNIAFDIGFATAIQKQIFVVDEMQNKYFAIPKASTLQFNNIEELIKWLNSYQQQSESENTNSEKPKNS